MIGRGLTLISRIKPGTEPIKKIRVIRVPFVPKIHSAPVLKLPARGILGKLFPGCGGGSRIRTHEGVAPLTVFKTAAFNHSAIPPACKCERKLYNCGRALRSVNAALEVGVEFFRRDPFREIRGGFY